MRWQQIARLVFVAIGLGAAAAIYVLQRPRPPVEKTHVSSPVDPAATMQAGRGTDVRSRNGQVESALTYDTMKDYPDSRVAYGKVHLTLNDGTEVWADAAEAKGKSVNGEGPGDLVLTGNVRMGQPSEGFSVKGDSGTYSDATGIAVIPGAVTFTRGRMTGTGTGGEYDRDAGIFKILADTHVTMAPQADGAGAVEATSQAMRFTRADKSMYFDQHAQIVRASSTLTADAATLFLSDDEQQIRIIQLRGNSKITSAADKKADAPDMQAADIDLTFYPDGQAVQNTMMNRQAVMVVTNDQGKRSIEGARVSFTAAPDGKTLTRLEGADHVVVRTPAAAGTPERVIKAATLLATGDPKNGLTDARFTGGVDFQEVIPAAAGKPASKRTGTSQTLALKLKGQLDAIEEAQFQQNATFQSGDVSGNADLGVYFASAGKLELRPLTPARRTPHVTDGSLGVDAAELITVFLDSNNLDARRDVKTVKSADTSGKPKKDVGLFNGTDTIFGFGAEFHYDDAAKTTRYLGVAGAPARLKQGESLVSGLDVLLGNETQDLSASGKVESVFLATESQPDAKPDAKPSAKPDAKANARPDSKATAKPAEPTRYHAWADALVYKDAERIATYTGAPARLKSEDSETEGKTIVLTMAKDTQTLERLDATADVYAVLQGGREARGDSLVYEVVLGRYTLKGAPLILKNVESDGTCSKGTSTVVIFNRELGAPTWPQPHQVSKMTSCSESIR